MDTESADGHARSTNASTARIIAIFATRGLEPEEPVCLFAPHSSVALCVCVVTVAHFLSRPPSSAMFAFPLNAGNPNVITISAGVNGEGVFDSTMPARLTGIITPGEFAGSIQRCNAAYAPGAARTLARMLIFGGIIFWIIFIAVFVFTTTSGG